MYPHLTLHRALSTSRATPPRSRRKPWSYPLGASLLLLPALFYYFTSPSQPVISPHAYSDHPISCITHISPRHALVNFPIPPSSIDLFGSKAVNRDTTPRKDGQVIVQHVLIKNPDLQIEREYTPINDVEKEGEVKVVVKKVKGGEVGRLVHSLKDADTIGIRGPVTTFSIDPSEYGKIIMISTGTGMSPFLQLLSKLSSYPPPASSPSILNPNSSPPPSPSHRSSSQSASPSLHLIQLLPHTSIDWPTTTGLLPSLQAKLGDRLTIDRPSPGLISAETMQKALRDVGPDDKIMIFICLPPHLLRPLCGGLTPTRDQGPLTGLLANLGLSSDQVWKLE